MQRPRLVRGADGRLRSASADHDIGEVWAEQQRIRLKEAIAEDQHKALRQQQSLIERLTTILRAQIKALELSRLEKFIPKSLASKIQRSRLKLTKSLTPVIFGRRWRWSLLAAGLGVLVVLGAIVAYLTHDDSNWVAKRSTNGVVAKSSIQIPTYDTVLPAGKQIEDLGGWARVSPPEKDPVFAFVDSVSGIRLTISEQPLPESFHDDPAGKMADLAQQFNAKEQVTFGDMVVYVGTSIRGPQSAIFAKDDLLVLIKADSKLTNDQWTQYIESLE